MIKFYNILKKGIPFPFNKIKFVFLDHDKTMTYKIDPRPARALFSAFLHPLAARSLNKALIKDGGFAILSTAHTKRLIKQYRCLSGLKKLIIIAESGSTIALPFSENGKTIFDIYCYKEQKELKQARKVINKIIADFREKNNACIFINPDLYANITIENFEKFRNVTKAQTFQKVVLELIINALKGKNLIDKIHLSSSQFGLEIAANINKDKIILMFKKILGDGNYISVGDSKADVPAFSVSYGIQVPAKDMRLDEIKPVKNVDAIVYGNDAAGAITAELIDFLTNRLEKINITKFKEDLIDEITKSRWSLRDRIDPATLKMDYDVPKGFDEFEKMLEKAENELNRMYS